MKSVDNGKLWEKAEVALQTANRRGEPFLIDDRRAKFIFPGTPTNMIIS